MSDDRIIMKAGVIIAAFVIVVRIVLEQVGAPQPVSMVFGVVWLYFLFPILFALGIAAREIARPYGVLLKDVALFALYTRIMVAVTYMLAYVFRWPAPRFSAGEGGVVGENVSRLNGLLVIPVRNVLIWVVTAAIVGMIVGSVTLLLKRSRVAGAAAH